MNNGSSSEEEAALRREAAMWVARMERPDAASQQARLDRWLNADPRHAAAYARAARRFEEAAILNRSTRFPPERSPGNARLLTAMCVALAGCALAAALLFQLHETRPTASLASRTDALRAQAKTFQSRAGEIRTERLPDGSVLTLDTDSVVRIRFGTERRLVLERGRARFSVIHDGRTFIVEAGGGTVTARGTLFDVALAPTGAVDVSLIEGAVDVAEPAKAASRRLRPGQTMAYGRPDTPRDPILMRQVAESGWPEGIMEFDCAPLSRIIERANRYATRPIRLEDPDLGALAASGRFRVNDAPRLAANLARLLDLKADFDGQGAIILRRP